MSIAVLGLGLLMISSTPNFDEGSRADMAAETSREQDFSMHIISNNVFVSLRYISVRGCP